ncbi:hypothetical protein GCM10023259_091020 [Thermocatellispora tengchongensis]
MTGVLGAGGQGVVYRGEASSGVPVAVKLLHIRMAADSDVRRRFMRETDAARRVAVFCTAQVLDMGVFNGRPYVVSEYIPGPSLAGVVAEDGPRGGSGLHRLAVTTLTALAAIHRAGIVHRDFKPGNVILGPEGPVVIDFGIARVLDESATASGLVGTPAYMAPEQFDGQKASPASDVFAWAATMVYAATGHQAFTGPTVPALINAVLARDPDLSGVPDDLRPLLARCLAKDPAARPEIPGLLHALTGNGPAQQAQQAQETQAQETQAQEAQQAPPAEPTTVPARRAPQPPPATAPPAPVALRVAGRLALVFGLLCGLAPAIDRTVGTTRQVFSSSSAPDLFVLMIALGAIAVPAALAGIGVFLWWRSRRRDDRVWATAGTIAGLGVYQAATIPAYLSSRTYDPLFDYVGIWAEPRIIATGKALIGVAALLAIAAALRARPRAARPAPPASGAAVVAALGLAGAAAYAWAYLTLSPGGNAPQLFLEWGSVTALALILPACGLLLRPARLGEGLMSAWLIIALLPAIRFFASLLGWLFVGAPASGLEGANLRPVAFYIAALALWAAYRVYRRARAARISGS